MKKEHLKADFLSHRKTPPTPAQPSTNPLRASPRTPPPSQTSLHAPFLVTTAFFPFIAVLSTKPHRSIPSISPPFDPMKKEPASAGMAIPEVDPDLEVGAETAAAALRRMRTIWNNAETKTVPIR